MNNTLNYMPSINPAGSSNSNMPSFVSSSFDTGSVDMPTTLSTAGDALQHKSGIVPVLQ